MDVQEKICQSCSMPLIGTELFGTEKDGSLNQDYCIHCYKAGEFTNPQATLESYVEFAAPQWGSWTHRPTLSLEEARAEVRARLSPLKRWKNSSAAPKRRCGCCR